MKFRITAVNTTVIGPVGSEIRVDVPPKKVPYFKPGKELKELINREPVPPLAPPSSSDTGVPGY